MRSSTFAFVVMTLLAAAGCDEPEGNPVHIRPWTEGVGEIGCVPLHLELLGEDVPLACDADGLTMSGVVHLPPGQATVVLTLRADGYEVLDPSIEVPAGASGRAIWASVRVVELPGR